MAKGPSPSVVDAEKADAQPEERSAVIKRLTGPVLVGLLIASAVLNLWAAGRYYFTLRQIHGPDGLQAWAVHINQTLAAVQLLGSEAVKYSQQNPAIDPILQEFGFKPKPGAAVPGAGTSTNLAH